MAGLFCPLHAYVSNDDQSRDGAINDKVSSIANLALSQAIELTKVLERIGFLQDGHVYQTHRLANFDVFAE